MRDDTVATSKPDDNGVPEAWRPAVELWKAVDWHDIESGWQERYWETVQYSYENARTPPVSNPGAGRWVKEQCRNRVRLTPTQRQLLRAIPSWHHALDPGPISDTQFTASYDAYMKLAHQKGGALQQFNAETKEERTLARWLLNIKGYKKYHPGMLSAEQCALLEQLPGFSWDLRGNGKRKGPEGVRGPELPFFSLEQLFE